METRLGRLRAIMDAHDLDAVVLRDVACIKWLTGCERVFDDEAAHTVLVTGDGAWLHTDSRYFTAIMGQIDADVWATDMEAMPATRWLAAKVASARVHRLGVEDTLTLGFFDELTTELDAVSHPCFLVRLHQLLVSLRLIKEPVELECLRRAQEVTDEAFGRMCARLHVGMSELEIRALLEGELLSCGADALSFDTIIASGPNGANPHARPGERRIADGDLIVCDFGACWHDYHADMTRTVCMGTPSAEQREVYAVVRRAHEESAAMARPGITGAELHAHAQKVIADAGYGEFFGHGLGHGVGLEIHEAPAVSLRGKDPLPEGAVFTIEPGIYLPNRFGIRLEDCGVMGKAGYEPFTATTHELICL